MWDLIVRVERKRERGKIVRVEITRRCVVFVFTSIFPILLLFVLLLCYYEYGLGRRPLNPHGIRWLSQWLMQIAKHLMLFFVVYLQMSFTEYLTSQLPRRRGKYWRPHIKEQRR